MIKIKNLTVKLGNFSLKDINLDIKPHEYFVILGPTGAGKTILLESIAGLYPLSFGEIWFNQQKISSSKPENRQIGMVYQDQVLFPHFSVKENIAFGLKLKKYSLMKIKEKVENIAELFEITSLLNRKPYSLSGGEKQRVALARALVIEPKLLLLDEPLSSLDPEVKERMQRKLREVHQRLKVTIIHVTHDFAEALTLGHRVAVLNQGCIMQVGPSEEFLQHPSCEFVARFGLARNIFAGQAEEEKKDSYSVIKLGNLKLKALCKKRGKINFSLRPEDIFISKDKIVSAGCNCFQGIIKDITNQGPVLHITVSLPPDFICLITKWAFGEMGLKKGVKVWINFKDSALHVF